MPEKVIVIGAGGHGRVIADILRSAGREVLGFLDDRAVKKPGINVLGRIEDAPGYSDSAEFIIGIGSNKARMEIAGRFAGVLRYTAAVHKNAVIAPGVVPGEGSVVMAGAIVNVGAVIGSHCIINTSASVDHDCVLADFVHLSPGAHLAGNVTLGMGCWLGIGGAVINGVSVCPWCVIGAGGVVIKNLKQPGTYVGVPASLKAANE